MKNRLSAQKSRDTKKVYVDELEKQVQDLQDADKKNK